MMSRAAPRTLCTIIFSFALSLYPVPKVSWWQWAHCGRKESSALICSLKPPRAGAQVPQRCQEFALLPGPTSPLLHMCLTWDKTPCLCQAEGGRCRNRGEAQRRIQQAKAVPEPLEVEGQLRKRSENAKGRVQEAQELICLCRGLKQ